MPSPFHKDERPSFTVFPSRGTSKKLMFKDHALGIHGSCFDLVMRKYNLTFVEALQVINNDFGLNLECDNGIKKLSIRSDFEYSKVDRTPIRVEFDIKYRPFTYKDLKYWAQFNISPELLALYNVKCVESYWMIRGDITRFYRCLGKLDTTYCYQFLEAQEVKLYRPYDKELRFLSNCSSTTIQGMEQLPKKGKLVVDTKSLKDVMTLRSFNIYSIAPQAESVLISKEAIEILRKRFPNIFSLKDFDLAGVRIANKGRKLYGIEPYFLTNGRFRSSNYGSKDISDYVKDNGVENTVNLLKNVGLIFKER